MSRLPRNVWERLDTYWDGLSYVEQIGFLYAMAMLLMMGLLLLRFVLAEGLV